MNSDRPKRPDPTPAPPLAGFKVVRKSRSASVGIAAHLRLIAGLLEDGQMVWKSGSIVVNSNHSGDVTIESSLILSCQKQLTVAETPGIEEITLFDPACEVVYQMLDRMGPGAKKLTTFDPGEDEQWNAWVRAINNRGDYPKYLQGRMFEVKPYRNANQLGVWTVRLV